MKKKILTLAGCALAIASFNACMNDDSDNGYVYYSYFTITGEGDNYVLYGDEDSLTVYPTPESVASITSGKGFGSNRRAELYMVYQPENVSMENGREVLRGAVLKGGSYIRTISLMTPAEAQAENVCVADSIFPIVRLERIWGCNGFLNTIVTGDYSANNNGGIRPTVNLVVTCDEGAENAATLRLLYNRHSAKDCYTMGRTQFMTSYDAALLQEVPGTDSISLTVYADTIYAGKLKLSRNSLVKPAGL